MDFLVFYIISTLIVLGLLFIITSAAKHRLLRNEYSDFSKTWKTVSFVEKFVRMIPFLIPCVNILFIVVVSFMPNSVTEYIKCLADGEDFNFFDMF